MAGGAVLIFDTSPPASLREAALLRNPAPTRLNAIPCLPRRLAIELTTRRSTAPCWRLTGGDQDLDFSLIAPLLREMAQGDPGWTLDLGGSGDPLLSPDWWNLAHAARSAGATRITLETDLLVEPEQITHLAAAVDVVFVHLPAATSRTYVAAMGVDGLDRALDNVARLVALGQQAAAARVVPVLVKCRRNAAEVQEWLATWRQRLDCAIVRGMDGFAGEHACLARAAAPEAELRVLAGGMMTDELSRPLGALVRDGAGDAWQRRMALRPGTGADRKEAA